MEKENTEERKFTYEELSDIANKLSTKVSMLENYNKQLIDKVNELSQFAGFKRLDYLFKVLKYANMFDVDFVNSVITELKDTMTIHTDNKETSNGE